MFSTRKILNMPFLLIFLCFAFAHVAKADTAVITGGSITFQQGLGPNFTLTGPGLVINGITTGFSSDTDLTINTNELSNVLSRGFSSGSSNLLLRSPLVVGGVTYTFTSGRGAPFITLIFAAPSFVIPFQNFPGAVVTAPFVLTGGAVGNENVNTLPGTTTLTGEGVATLVLSRTSLPNEYLIQTLTYTFGATTQGVTVIATPEPTTMILLGTGLAGIAAKVRRRRKQ